jgi:hypothetical protein
VVRLQPNIVEALKLWAWLIAGILALAANIVLGLLTSWKFASTTGQLIGSALAFIGLLVAYLRARHPGETLAEQVRQFGRRLCGRATRTHTGEASANLTLRPSGAVGLAPLEDLKGLTVQQQVDALAFYIRNTMNTRTQVLLERVGALKVALSDAQDAAAEKAEEIYRRVRVDLEEMRRDMKQSAVLDLRFAIFGLYVATIGVALSFG